ncbi:hypothetical protein ARMGADRAFT_55929 [Armillaria gallica]|uniref:Uncharacterized protein n=1 Tax=Armillaria gallica TaxID=47427 RepID=A0A2H3F1T0_ARMGA|nr:hypothetical protein ARMGADRAFT_55929 [Armillaria gallica]
MFSSWIAQASQLQLCTHSRDHVNNDELHLINTEFHLHISPWKNKKKSQCNILMAKDHHMLSLSISPPSIDYQTNKLK